MDIQSLRNLQISLNADIDAYIAAVEHDSHDSEQRKAEAQDRIHTKAVRLTDITSIPVFEVVRLSLQTTITMGIRVAIDLDLFNLVNDQETLNGLVQKTGADESLVLRVARMMVAAHVFDEPAVHTYKSTPLSKALRAPGCRDFMRLGFDTMGKFWGGIPSFIRANGLNDIDNLDHNPTKQMTGTGFFEDLALDPERETAFNSGMSIWETLPDEWYAHYPYEQVIDEICKQSESADAVFIVDVGGGSGSYLKGLTKSYPYIPGRLIVQDLEPAISAIPSDSGFESMVHDFFGPQPVHGAKFYHFRNVLHDWPDNLCVKILQQLRPAFRPGYSRLLLHGIVLRDSQPDLFECIMDLAMWPLCGMERSEMQWSQLLGVAGFKIINIIRAQAGPMGIVEAVLDDGQIE